MVGSSVQMSSPRPPLPSGPTPPPNNTLRLVPWSTSRPLCKSTCPSSALWIARHLVAHLTQKPRLTTKLLHMILIRVISRPLGRWHLYLPAVLLSLKLKMSHLSSHPPPAVPLGPDQPALVPNPVSDTPSCQLLSLCKKSNVDGSSSSVARSPLFRCHLLHVLSPFQYHMHALPRPHPYPLQYSDSAIFVTPQDTPFYAIGWKPAFHCPMFEHIYFIPQTFTAC